MTITNNNDDILILLWFLTERYYAANRWCVKGANCVVLCCILMLSNKRGRTSHLKLVLFAYRQLNKMLNILVLLDFVYSEKLNNTYEKMGFKLNASGDVKLFSWLHMTCKIERNHNITDWIMWYVLA